MLKMLNNKYSTLYKRNCGKVCEKLTQSLVRVNVMQYFFIHLVALQMIFLNTYSAAM